MSEKCKLNQNIMEALDYLAEHCEYAVEEGDEVTFKLKKPTDQILADYGAIYGVSPEVVQKISSLTGILSTLKYGTNPDDLTRASISVTNSIINRKGFYYICDLSNSIIDPLAVRACKRFDEKEGENERIKE